MRSLTRLETHCNCFIHKYVTNNERLIDYKNTKDIMYWFESTDGQLNSMR